MTESEADRWYELRKVIMLESLPGYFRKRAGDAFAQKQDVKANLCRILADDFEAQAVTERTKYEQKYFGKT